MSVVRRRDRDMGWDGGKNELMGLRLGSCMVPKAEEANVACSGGCDGRGTAATSVGRWIETTWVDTGRSVPGVDGGGMVNERYVSMAFLCRYLPTPARSAGVEHFARTGHRKVMRG